MSRITYIVKTGDTFERIAHRFLYNPARGYEIFQYNRLRIKSGNYNEIFAGEKIYIQTDDLSEKKETIKI